MIVKTINNLSGNKRPDTFVLDGKEDGVQVLYKDDTIWATQKAMSILFDCATDNIGLHDVDIEYISY